MTRSMKAYRMVSWQRPPQMAEVEVPRPSRDEVLVRVAGNGLCHSDLGMQHMSEEIGRGLGWRMPFTLGHEIGGWIEELGEAVVGLSAGDAVALVAPHSCGTCSYCIRGQDSACVEGGAGRGYGRDGGLAQYVVARAAREVIRLGKLDPRAAAPLTDAGATSYHGVRRVLPKLVPGSTAVVVGAGGLGGFAIQLLRVLSAARVVAVDLNAARLALAGEMGAHELVAGVGPSTAGDLLALTNGEGAEAVLDFVGTDETIAAGLAAVRRAGAFALIGAAGGTFAKPWYFALPREAEVFCFQGSTIADAREVIALAEGGFIRSEIDIFPLARVAEAYERLERGELRGRAVVTPGG